MTFKFFSRRSRAATGRPFPRQDRVRLAAQAVVESLENRQLFTVTVPDGAVAIGFITIDSTSSAGTDTPTLKKGHDYFFVASGEHQLAVSPLREADAAGFESA